MNESRIEFVDLPTARAARGLRLVVSGIIPSPWSEAAKGVLHMKGLAVLAVRLRRGDEELRAWTGAHNVPVVINDDEPARTGWAEILALAERLDGRVPLVPNDPEARVRMYGLVNELGGEGGLGWCARLLMLHGTFTSEGARSFPLPVSQYLAPKYGYAAERIAPARARMLEVLALLEAQRARSQAAGHAYLLGDCPTALDIYLSTFLTPLAGLPEQECPDIAPPAAAAFAYLSAEMGPCVPPGLLAQRRMMFERHLPWPIRL